MVTVYPAKIQRVPQRDLKMSGYDYRYLQTLYPYIPSQIEKVCRISDILARVSQIPFLRERLSLYGGTALNFIHFSEVHRLSVDMDFNYRHQGEEKDWGEIRAEIDAALKQILSAQGYPDHDIKIDPSYPLSRLTINYINHLDTDDTFKIETGYMRRIPVLTEDSYMNFRHIGTDVQHTIKTPQTEEIYANKLVTLLARATPRDLYDVYKIAETKTDQTKLRKLAIIESFMSLPEPIIGIDIRKTVNTIPLDDRLRTVLRTQQDLDIREIRKKVTAYTKKIIDSITDEEEQCINIFYTEKQFEYKTLKLEKIHPEINAHPAITRALQQLQ